MKKNNVQIASEALMPFVEAMKEIDKKAEEYQQIREEEREAVMDNVWKMWIESSQIDKRIDEEFVDWQERVWQILCFGYRNEDRFYHSFDHIVDCLHKFKLIKDKIKYPKAFELAIWFHDIIYNPLSKNNEDESANLAYNLIYEIDKELAVRVKELVLFTKWDSSWFLDGSVGKLYKTHGCDFETLNEDFLYLRDIDWSGFGMDWDYYCSNTEDICRESPYMDYETFCRKRIGFLEWLKVLQDNYRPLYSTEFFSDMLTERANQNINRELELLKEKIKK